MTTKTKEAKLVLKSFFHYFNNYQLFLIAIYLETFAVSLKTATPLWNHLKLCSYWLIAANANTQTCSTQLRLTHGRDEQRRNQQILTDNSFHISLWKYFKRIN